MNNFEKVEEIKFGDSGQVYANTVLLRIIGSGIHVRVIKSPFANCQIWSMAPFQSLFRNGDFSEAANKLKEIKTGLFISKKLCQIDITNEIYEKVKDYLNIHCEMKYTNTNGHKMVGLLIKV